MKVLCHILTAILVFFEGIVISVVYLKVHYKVEGWHKFGMYM